MSLLKQQDDWDAAISAFDQQRLDEKTQMISEPEFREKQAFLEKHAWPVFRAQLDHRYERHRVQSRLNWTLWFSGLGLAASVAVVLMVVLPAERTMDFVEASSPGLRTKGVVGVSDTLDSLRPKLNLRLGDIDLVDGHRVTPGADLKLFVTSGDYDHVLVFGVEESGAMTPYYPDSASGQSLLVGQGRGLPLPDGIQLDDSLGAERFVALFSKGPMSWQAVSKRAKEEWMNAGQRVKAFGKLGFPETAEASVWFVKELK